MTSSLPRLSAAPVVSILGQVRFSPVLSIESFVPKVQEELRKKGFPKFEKIAQQSMSMRGDGVQLPPTVENVWRFSDREDSQYVTLTTNGVTLQSSINQVATEFDGALLDIIATVHSIVGPELILRIGLRYVNVIQPAEKKASSAHTDLADYVRGGLLGIPLEKAGIKNSTWHTNSLHQTEFGLLILQVRHPISENFLPPDLFLGPEAKIRPLRACPSLVLDLDHFANLNLRFEIELIEKTLTNFHSVLDRVFESAVTELALDEWK
jgi:uncharacterized protein (TIGR04255 family)